MRAFRTIREVVLAKVAPAEVVPVPADRGGAVAPPRAESSIPVNRMLRVAFPSLGGALSARQIERHGAVLFQGRKARFGQP